MGLIFIENAGTKAGILLNTGGRIVSLQKNNGQNILESNPDLWNERESEKIIPNPFAEFKAYNGHEVWIGPQSQWWKHQNLNPEKRDSTLFWPPDPYISFDNYTILEQKTDSILIQGNKSPISGIQFTKRIKIDDLGKLHFEVSARNIRQEAIAWDLWLLTRVNGHNLNFVPVDSPQNVSISEPTHPHQGKAPYQIKNGFFSFMPLKMDKNYEECTAKAFINPSKPYMASLAGNNLLIIHFEKHNTEEIHPEQKEVEIYNFATDQKETSLLEMEYHAQYKILQPEESMNTSEIWEIHSFAKYPTEKEIVNFLNKL